VFNDELVAQLARGYKAPRLRPFVVQPEPVGQLLCTSRCPLVGTHSHDVSLSLCCKPQAFQCTVMGIVRRRRFPFG
jgi:hypothetical protein